MGHGLVWNLAGFLEDHPGGNEVLEAVAGKDSSAEFEEFMHSVAARRDTRIELVGVLEGCEAQVQDWRAKGWTEDQGIPDVEQLKKVGGVSASGGHMLLSFGATVLTVTCAAAVLLLRMRK